MQIFRLIKKVFFLGLTILSNFTNALDCISMKNRECKVSSEIININSNNPLFYPFSIKVNKCSGNCNDINDPYARICVPVVVKNLNVKLFNLMPRTNETRHIKWHENCKCICRLDKIICDNKQKWNKDKLMKAYAIKDIFGIQVIVNASAINLVILVSIYAIKIVNAKKN